VTGPIFNYKGPYYFKPPFTVATGGQHASGGGSHPAKQPPPVNRPAPKPVSQPQPAPVTQPQTQPTAVALAPVASHPRGLPGVIWLVVPIGMLLFAAVAAVVFEGDDEPRRRPAVVVAAQAQAKGAGKAPAVQPPAGPFVMLGFATRRVAGAIAARGRKLLGRSL